MKISVSKAAEMLNLPEDTVNRWISQGKIPAREEAGETYFVYKELKKWAQEHSLKLQLHKKTGSDILQSSKITLYESIKRGGVFYGITGENLEDVVKNSIASISLPATISRDNIAEQIMQREGLASTGIGGGVAIPHPRFALGKSLEHPVISICFLEHEIDFKAVDGEAVFVLFFMFSPLTRIHLELLSKLGFCLKDKGFIKLLKQRCSPDDLLEYIHVLEEKMAK